MEDLPCNEISKFILSRIDEGAIKRGWLGSLELCYVLGCSERTIIRWRKNKRIKCYKILNSYRYFIKDIYDFYVSNCIC